MWNLCCSYSVKKQHNSRDFAEVNLTALLPWVFFGLTLFAWLPWRIVNHENISLLKVESSNQNAMLNIY